MSSPSPSPRRRPSLAARAATYAGATLVVLTALQAAVFAPTSRLELAALLAPLVVCTALTYLVASAIVRARARSLVDVYDRFRRGEALEAAPFPDDPELREARELFVRLAHDLQHATRRLEHRDAERRRLFADVVHELGTPVSSLLGLAEAFARPELCATPEQRDRLARGVLGESERLARFIEDLRDLAQLDDPELKLERQEVDLGALAREVVERFNAIPDATPVEVEAESVRSGVDPARIEQVLANLIANARRYALRPAPIRARVCAGAERATIVVEDGGPGVAESDLPKLGERMRRLDASRTRRTGGTGLGLSIVAAIAERHGGAVRYGRSSLGGLRVEVELPRTA